MDLAGRADTFPVRTTVHWAEPDQEVHVTAKQGGVKVAAGDDRDYAGVGCYAEEGSITVDRVEVDPSTSLLTAFDGSFDQRCAGSTGLMHGELHFQR